MSIKKIFGAPKEIRRLNDELKGLQAEVARQKNEIAGLHRELQKTKESAQIFEKAFRVIGFIGDYVEFGAFRGDSLAQAYFAAKKVYDEIAQGEWNHAYADSTESRAYFLKAWDGMRFIAFDSFQGMPEPGGVDAIHRVFQKGTYACSETEFRANLRKYEIPDAKTIAVPGFFSETLTPATAAKLNLRTISVIHIDSDLYESARAALEFCTPYMINGTIVIFDEWFQFYGHPDLGERRAFREWMEAHRDWLVTPFQTEGAFRNSFILNRPVRPATATDP